MKTNAYNAFRLLRPRQWIKNFAIYAAITFSGELFDINLLQRVTLGFFIFCGLSSAIYILNDIFDVKKDRMHPFKKFRPIAHGDIPVPLALILAILLIAVSLFFSLTITRSFFICTIVYVAIQIFYSAFLKTIAIIDILAIATGYILRVYSGEFATGLHISVWLLLTTVSISLFLAIGKRRSELTLISNRRDVDIADTRKALSHYSERLLDVYASIFATSTFITYTLFTFLEPQNTRITLNILMPDFLPAFFQRKWLMVTILPVVYGLMRYLQDIYEKHEGESPERVLLGDKPLLISVIIWVLLVMSITYIFQAG